MPMRWLLVMSLTLSASALAQAECKEAYLECEDDCSIEFGGSNTVPMKKKFEKCIKKCTKTANRCSERILEAKAGNLDEGALDGTPTSDSSDKDGLPVSKKKKKRSADPLDDERPDDEPVKKKDPLADGEIPKSNRTTLKTDEPAPVAKKEDSAPKKAEVIEMKMTPKEEPRASSSSSKKDPGDDLRDDKPRAASPPPSEDEPPPPPKKEKKKEEPPPKKKEEDHDDLRFY